RNTARCRGRSKEINERRTTKSKLMPMVRKIMVFFRWEGSFAERIRLATDTLLTALLKQNRSEAAGSGRSGFHYKPDVNRRYGCHPEQILVGEGRVLINLGGNA